MQYNRRVPTWVHGVFSSLPPTKERGFFHGCRLYRILTVTLSGEIDHHRVKGVLQDLDQAIDEVLPRQLIVDCAGITFMDSSGIAVLLRLWQRMGELDGTIQVTGLPEQPARVLRAAGLQRLIPLT